MCVLLEELGIFQGHNHVLYSVNTVILFPEAGRPHGWTALS
jgi:hypothetical protein